MLKSKNGKLTLPPPHLVFSRYKKLIIMGGAQYPITFINIENLLGYNSINRVSFFSCDPLPNLSFNNAVAHLNFCSCLMSSISFIRELPNLQSLMLANPPHYLDMEPLRYNTSIRNLVITYMKLEDISFLHGNTTLSELDLSSNNIKDVSVLSSCSNLKKLLLQKNGIEDLSHLASLPHLETLDISNNNIDDISEVVGCNLKRLFCSRNKIIDMSCFFRNSSIGHVAINGNPVSLDVQSSVLYQCSLNALNESKRTCTLFDKLVRILEDSYTYTSWFSWVQYHTYDCKSQEYGHYLCENEPDKLYKKFEMDDLLNQFPQESIRKTIQY
jgi:hypothetical protein